MKKILVIAVCIMIGFSVFSVPAQNRYNYIFATGGTSGTYYPFGGAIAQIWNTKIPGMNVTAQSTGASKENIRLVDRGEAELAIVQNDVMDYAFKGIELFNGEKVTGFRTIATLYPEVVQIVVNPNSRINTIADMKGKKISVGDAGSGVEANAIQVLDVAGLSRDDLGRASRLSFKESANAYKDRQIDGFFVTAGVPNAAIQEIAALGSVKVLPITEPYLSQLQNKYSFYTPYTINKATYAGMPSDVVTLAVKATLIVKADLPADVVYQLTKALFENQSQLAVAHAKGKELALSEAVKGASVPFHPGAERYYREKGVLK